MVQDDVPFSDVLCRLCAYWEAAVKGALGAWWTGVALCFVFSCDVSCRWPLLLLFKKEWSASQMDWKIKGETYEMFDFFMVSSILIFRAFKFVVLLSTLSRSDIRWAIWKSLSSNCTLIPSLKESTHLCSVSKCFWATWSRWILLLNFFCKWQVNLAVRCFLFYWTPRRSCCRYPKSSILQPGSTLNTTSLSLDLN